MKNISLFAALATTTTAALAQQATLPFVLNTTSCCTSGNVWRAGVNRVQCIYDSTSINPYGLYGPILIDRLEYRLGDGLTGAAVTYPNVEVYLQYSATDFAAPSTTFANNRSVAFPTTPNFAGPVNVALSAGTAPNDYAINIPLTTPFLFDPSLGQDLLIELVMLTAPTPLTGSTMSTANTLATHRCNSVRSTSTTATTGATSAFCPIVRLSYTIPPGTAEHEPYGTGCYSVARSFYELFPGAHPASTNDLSNTTMMAVQNGNGGYDVTTVPGATLVPPTTTGLALTDDVMSAAITLPFTFDFPGGSTTQIRIDSNGSIALATTPTPASTIGGNVAALLNANTPRIAASMQDLLPDGATNIDNVYAEVDPSNPNVFLITWLNVPCFWTTTPATPLTSTFQVALIDNGTNDFFEVRYQTLVNDSTSNTGIAITGFSLGAGAIDGGSRDLTAGLVSTSADLGPLTLSAPARPVLGNQVTYTLSNVRPNLGVSLVRISFLEIPGGLDLTSVGVAAPGCSAWIGPLNTVPFGPLLFGSPTASFSWTWPLGPWSGTTVRVQGFELSPAENAAGVIASNGMHVLLGNQ